MKLFITVLFMCFLTGAEVDLFIPSFPEIKGIFHLSAFMVELTLGVNLIAHCITSLFVGALGDYYGRRPIIILGLIIFIIGSLFCVFATSYYMLLFGRLLQGIGISGPAVLSYILIADTYSTTQQQQLMGKLNGIITFSMAFAPVLGSYISLYFHWQGNFVFLLLLGLVSLILALSFVPDKKTEGVGSLSITQYKVVFESSITMNYIFVICLLVLPYWLFIGMSSILYVEDLGVSLRHFGFYQGTMALLFSVASFTSGYFIAKFGQRACFNFSIIILLLFIVLCVVLILLQVKDPFLITSILQLLALGIIFPANILYPLALESIPGAKGRISAVIVSMRLIFTAISVQFVSYIYDKTFAFIGITMCAIISLMLYLCYKLFQKHDVFSQEYPRSEDDAGIEMQNPGK